MKTIFFFILSVLLFFSCKKYQAGKELSKEILGTWEMETFIGFPSTISFPRGNGNTVAFLPGGTIEKKQSDTIVFQGTYSLDKKADCYPSDNDVILRTSEDSNYYQYIEVKNGKLTLSTPNCYVDGGTSYWRKL
jgi:hypothetical protein